MLIGIEGLGKHMYSKLVLMPWVFIAKGSSWSIRCHGALVLCRGVQKDDP